VKTSQSLAIMWVLWYRGIRNLCAFQASCTGLLEECCSINQPASRCFLSQLIRRPWRWRRHILPKHQLTFGGVHCDILQKIELLVTTAGRISNPLLLLLFLLLLLLLLLFLIYGLIMLCFCQPQNPLTSLPLSSHILCPAGLSLHVIFGHLFSPILSIWSSHTFLPPASLLPHWSYL
jgi:hypothetical protein